MITALTTKRMAAHVCVGLLIAAGCGEDVVQPSDPLVAGGRIAGVVRSGEIRVDGIVRADRITEAPHDYATFQAEINPNGSYQMDVPAGRYVVELRVTGFSARYEYSEAGIGSGSAGPDTLVVDEHTSPVSANFDLSSVRFHLEVSSSLNGGYGSIELHKRSTSSNHGRAYVSNGNASIANGALDLAFPGVLPGAYKVEVVLTPPSNLFRGRESLWMPGTRDSADAPWFDVVVDETTDVTGQLNPQLARIEGEITGAWMDLGLSPPTVALFSLDSTVVSSSQGVAPDGSFRLQVSIPEPVKLQVQHLGIARWIGGQSFAEGKEFQLESGVTISGVRFVQSGLLLDVDAPSSPFVTVRAELYDAGSLSLVANTYKQGWDRFLAIPNLVPGTYLLRFEPLSPGRDPWIPQWFDRATMSDNATAMTISHAGQVVPVSVVLETGGTMSGTVLDPGGDATDSYRIYITHADNVASWSEVFVSRKQPTFEFVGLPNGDWKVGASRRSGPIPRTIVWFPGTTDWEAAEAIPIRDFDNVTGVDIVIPAVRR